MMILHRDEHKGKCSLTSMEIVVVEDDVATISSS